MELPTALPPASAFTTMPAPRCPAKKRQLAKIILRIKFSQSLTIVGRDCKNPAFGKPRFCPQFQNLLKK
eukprot:905725-Amphidinium_carterae.1